MGKTKIPKILVIGDIMLDYCEFGLSHRLSPEAPVPIIQEITKKTYALGGAGNVSANLSRFPCSVSYFGIIGDDTIGKKVKQLLNKHKINTDHLLVRAGNKTTLKKRIFCNNAQICRFDSDVYLELKNDELLINNILKNQYDCIIISDYNKGCITNTLIKNLTTLKSKLNLKIVVDPKPRSSISYENVDYITPNQSEARLLFDYGPQCANQSEYLKAFLKHMKCKGIVITRAEKGLIAMLRNKPMIKIDAIESKVVDVCGAGDTLIAGFAYAIAAGYNFEKACEIGNQMAGIVVKDQGTSLPDKSLMQKF